MKRILYAIVLTLFVMLGAIPAYATTTDVNIVPPPPPSAPTNVTVSAITDTTVQVSWPAVTSALQYTVYLNGQVYSGSSNSQAALIGLTPHTNYAVYVIANNTGGDSPQSSSVNFTTLSPIPLAPPTPAITTTNTTAKILWQPLAANFNITKYTVYLDGQANTTITPQSGMQTATLNNLAIGNHTVALSATNDNREGTQSQPVSFTISPVPMPVGLQYYNKSSNTLWISWQPVPGASSYNIFLNGQVLGQSYRSSYVLEGLSANTNYQLSVVTVMPDGETSQSANLTVQTEEVFTPLTVTGLESNIFRYLPDLETFIEISFAVVATLKLSNILKLTLR